MGYFIQRNHPPPTWFSVTFKSPMPSGVGLSSSGGKVPWGQFLTILVQVLMSAFVLFVLAAAVKAVVDKWKEN